MGGGLLSGLEATGLMSLGSEESVQMLLILLCYALEYFLLLLLKHAPRRAAPKPETLNPNSKPSNISYFSFSRNLNPLPPR